MAKIRLCVDATPLLLRSAGVKTYLHWWTAYLRKCAGAHTLSLFPFVPVTQELNHENPAGSGRLAALARLAVLHSANYLGSGVLSWLRADIFHASHQLRRPPRNCRLTATVYDLTCWRMPEMHTPANVRAARRFADGVMRRADALIAISEQSRQDAVRLLGLDAARLHVIYPGIAPRYFDTAPSPAARPYALFVGTIEPRKNLETLLEAWSPELASDFDLVIAGPGGWGDATTLRRLRAGIPGVRYLGYVPESDVPGLTAGAAVFVYPSLYEGFGLPVAQAMAAGVPVVTSNVSSLPEIAGEAALLIDPRSPGDLRAALLRVLHCPALRAEMAAAGRRRAELYRWERCARQSWRLFESLV